MATERPIRVAVDAMGGDYAPAEIVAGAVKAAGQGDREVLLVGDVGRVEAELARHDAKSLPIGIVPSEGVIAEGESPTSALRQKPRASVLVATGLVKEGRADACVSMGSTGATMAAAAVILGIIEGIDRPALGGPIIGLAPQTMIIDVGTNVDCRPAQLLSFAVVGHVFARQLWNVESPRVSILSVGSESGKGNRLVRETSELCARSGLNFIGNIEANDLPLGKAEVVVCDGFVGNVVMKLVEGLGRVLAEDLRGKLEDVLPAEQAESLARYVYEVNNPVSITGGGPLFGVNGVSIVGHGRSDAHAVERAISTAALVVRRSFIDKVNEELVRVRAAVGTEDARP